MLRRRRSCRMMGFVVIGGQNGWSKTLSNNGAEVVLERENDPERSTIGEQKKDRFRGGSRKE